MVKACHEAKRHSSWINPDADYDQAIRTFVASILDEQSGQPFLEAFRSFHARISLCGHLNSLGQTLLKLAAPGVADTFQGSEIWDDSLVDPDNRRPVDYALRQRLLNDLKPAIESDQGDRARLCRELVSSRNDARVKLFLHHSVLFARREHPGLFTTGEFRPLEVTGAKSDSVLAFLRNSGETRASSLYPGSGPDCWPINPARARTSWRRTSTGRIRGSCLAPCRSPAGITSSPTRFTAFQPKKACDPLRARNSSPIFRWPCC